MQPTTTVTLPRLLRRSFAAGLLMAAAGLASAQPGGAPIRLLVGFPAGAGSDNIARILADKLKDQLGTSIVVENRAGAGGQIAAQALKAALEEQDGIRVAMTRTDDSFLSLSARVRRARDEAADLLISLHADSISVRSLRGATVYTLSDKASDALAQSLADQENREDAITGASLENAPEAIAAILVDLARTETRVFSTGLAQQVINSFEGQVKLIKNPLRHAGFRVLQAPDVPSVLVEMGYLSNREDEKLLNDEEWRKNTAQLLAQSVQNYREMILAGRR